VKNVYGYWLPEHDTHFEGYLHRLHAAGHPVEYQYEQKKHAFGYCSHFRTALDIGAHVGLWARSMTNVFHRVVAFEPYKPYIPMLRRNAPKAEVREHALGRSRSRVDITVPFGNTGAAFINEKIGDIDVIPLDELGAWSEVDFLKIDCEGYELPVLEGAVKLLSNNNPTIIVEQKPHVHFADKWGQYAAIEFLEALGYRVLARVIDDWILRK
jgi:FkbM family methyltransferase